MKTVTLNLYVAYEYLNNINL